MSPTSPKTRKRWTPSRRGMVAVFVALSLTMIVAAGALTLDGGLIVSERRRAQNVADAAALAGSYSLYNGQSVLTAESVAISSASANGYANYASNEMPEPSPLEMLAGLPIFGLPIGGIPVLANQGGGGPAPASVVASSPPSSGYFRGQSGYIQVNVTRYIPRYFSGIWWSTRMGVSAQSIARGITQPSAAPNSTATNAPFSLGILLLNSTMSGALTVNGTSMSIPSGSIVVNSSSSTAATTGAASAATSKSLSVSGNYSGNYTSTTTNTGATATPDPFAYLVAPVSTNLVSRTYSGPGTLQPGVYTGGITATSGTITLSPGIYYIKGGGLSITGSASLSGTNVMIYNAPTTTTDGITLGPTTGTISLSPLTAGPYMGFSLFQLRTSTAPVKLVGDDLLLNTLTINGAIYAAGAGLTLTESATGLTDVFGSRIVADHATTSGTGVINIGTGNATGVRDTRVIQ